MLCPSLPDVSRTMSHNLLYGNSARASIERRVDQIPDTFLRQIRIIRGADQVVALLSGDIEIAADAARAGHFNAPDRHDHGLFPLYPGDSTA
jgi:hypothetical protein